MTRLSSPVSVVVEGRSEAIPVMSLIVVPEFLASMTAAACLSSSQWMFTEAALPRTDAPMRWRASSVALVSSDISGLFNTNGPDVSAPRTMALCVYDLDGEAATVPLAVDDLIRIAVEPPPWRACR